MRVERQLGLGGKEKLEGGCRWAHMQMDNFGACEAGQGIIFRELWMIQFGDGGLEIEFIRFNKT